MLSYKTTEEATMQRRVALPFLAVVLMLAVGVAFVVSLSAGVPRASAYVLANGCDEYDPDRKITYRCTPDRSTFYTPDGINPNSVYPGTGALGDATINDNIGIPPPAPYVAGRDYCSNPPFAWSNFEGIWQRPCYNHDVCYGSQKGRLHCDVTLWKEMISACKAHYSWYHPFRYWCFSDVVDWYLAIRAFGAGSYKPRQTSSEPRGE
jgi:hypothetical protein